MPDVEALADDDNRTRYGTHLVMRQELARSLAKKQKEILDKLAQHQENTFHSIRQDLGELQGRRDNRNAVVDRTINTRDVVYRMIDTRDQLLLLLDSGDTSEAIQTAIEEHRQTLAIITNQYRKITPPIVKTDGMLDLDGLSR